jgi:hypothetical protein
MEAIKIFRAKAPSKGAFGFGPGGLPDEVVWLKSNYKEFVDFRWFNKAKDTPTPWTEIHILSEDLSIIFALKFGISTP